MNQPNILFFFPDQWRHDWTGFHPEVDVRTPSLLRLAGAGTRFTDVATPSPLCAPARACLSLGLDYAHCPVKRNQNNLPPGSMTFYRLLRDAGYHTMGCGKFDLHKADYSWGDDGRNGLDDWGFCDGIDCEGKFDGIAAWREGTPGPYLRFLERLGLAETHVADYASRDKWSWHPTPLPDDAYADNWIARSGLELLETAPANRPWFLQVNFDGPHDPWDVTSSMRESVQDRQLPAPVGDKFRDHPAAQEIRRNYAAMMENIDRWIGIYLDALEKRGELENTLVVFASDHGEFIGDHGLFNKCSWRHASVGVPMILRGPGILSGRKIETPASLLDLTAAFLEAAGISTPPDWDSRSLLGWCQGRSGPVRNHVSSALTAGKHDWQMVMDSRWKWVRDHGEVLLFDRKTDPEELVNLADRHPDVIRSLTPHQSPPSLGS